MHTQESKSRLKSIVDSNVFEIIILSVITINAVTLGLMTSPEIMAICGSILQTIDLICLVIFIFELVLKIITQQREFIKSGWNIFDFTVVLSCLISEISFFSAFRLISIFRILRLIRMITFLKPLQQILSSLLHSISRITWTALLLLIIFYIYAVIGTFLFGNQFPDWFGTIGKSLYTLFQVMTLESWSMGISRPVMAEFSMAWIYFVSFVMLASFIFMNVVVGILVSAVSDSSTTKVSKPVISHNDKTTDIYNFSDISSKNLGYYVYRLIDPRDNKTFYIGKGCKNRLFNHINDKLEFENNVDIEDKKEDETSNQMQNIRDIRKEGLDVNFVIMRYGMSEKEAIEVEAALIDAYADLGEFNTFNSNCNTGHGMLSKDYIISKLTEISYN